MVSAHIDEQEFRNALVDLTNVERQVLIIPDAQESEGPMKVQRRNSDSSLYCKAQLSERPFLSEKPTMDQARYLDRERLAFVESYLERAEDTRSMTTETSDSGMRGTHSAASEFGVEETGESSHRLCLKDVNERLIKELTTKLQRDPVSLVQFCRSFGIGHNKTYHAGALLDIIMLFPDTPVKMLTDVLKVLQMYDLVDLLEKAKPRALRPALPLTDIGQLSDANNRETTFYSKATVLILDTEETRSDIVQGINNIFKGVSSESEIERVGLELVSRRTDLEKKMQTYAYMENKFSTRHKKEVEKELKLIKQQRKYFRGIEDLVIHLLQQERELQTELAAFEEERKKWIEEEKPKMKDEIAEIKRDVEMKEKNVAADADQAWDKWIQQKDKQSTLFVIVEISIGVEARKMIEDLLRRKLPLPSNETKLLLTTSPAWKAHGKIPESLHVMHDGRSNVVTTIVEVLSKRWQTLDIVSVMREVQRTLPLDRFRSNPAFVMNDSLSSLPRLQNTKEEK